MSLPCRQPIQQRTVKLKQEMQYAWTEVPYAELTRLPIPLFHSFELCERMGMNMGNATTYQPL
jgi:hypothetical protein